MLSDSDPAHLRNGDALRRRSFPIFLLRSLSLPSLIESFAPTMEQVNNSCVGIRKLKLFYSIDVKEWKKRQILICAVNQGAEESFKKTVDVDRLIDTLRVANANEKDYEELASSVMSIVDCLVHKTNEINEREQEKQLDEGFLAEVNAQLCQAKEDEDKPGLQAMLQKVLQLYASRVLSKRSYAKNAISLH